MELTRITSLWLWCRFYTQFIFTYAYTISLIYIWKALDSKHNAVAGIIVALIGAVICHIAGKDSVRQFVGRYCTWLIILAGTIDATTELFLLIDPFTKLLGDVIAGPITFQIFRVMISERKNVIFIDPDDRALFETSMEKFSLAATMLGCLGVLLYEVSIQTTVYLSVFGNFLSVTLVLWRFRVIDKYIIRNRLKVSKALAHLY